MEKCLPAKSSNSGPDGKKKRIALNEEGTVKRFASKMLSIERFRFLRYSRSYITRMAG